MRAGEKVFEGKIGTLKRFKDDVREVASGFECGITLDGFNDIREGDIIEVRERSRSIVPCLRSATNSQPQVRTRKNANITVYDGTRIWYRWAPRWSRPPGSTS